jgi:hypothetical protein
MIETCCEDNFLTNEPMVSARYWYSNDPLSNIRVTVICPPLSDERVPDILCRKLVTVVECEPV